jgi:hypothetical protein
MTVQTVQITYLFPRWYADTSLRGFATFCSGFPTVGLTLEHRIPSNLISRTLSIWGLITCYASREELEAYIERHPKPFRDLQDKDGTSMLDVALSKNNLTAVEVLIAAGADSFAQDDASFPAMGRLMAARYQRDNETRRRLEQMLSIHQLYEEYNFTHLQKVVLGVRFLGLEAELRYRVNTPAAHFREIEPRTCRQRLVHTEAFVYLQYTRL